MYRGADSLTKIRDQYLKETKLSDESKQETIILYKFAFDIINEYGNIKTHNDNYHRAELKDISNKHAEETKNLKKEKDNKIARFKAELKDKCYELEKSRNESLNKLYKEYTNLVEFYDSAIQEKKDKARADVQSLNDRFEGFQKPEDVKKGFKLSDKIADLFIGTVKNYSLTYQKIREARDKQIAVITDQCNDYIEERKKVKEQARITYEDNKKQCWDNYSNGCESWKNYYEEQIKETEEDYTRKVRDQDIVKSNKTGKNDEVFTQSNKVLSENFRSVIHDFYKNENVKKYLKAKEHIFDYDKYSPSSKVPEYIYQGMVECPLGQAPEILIKGDYTFFVDTISEYGFNRDENKLVLPYLMPSDEGMARYYQTEGTGCADYIRTQILSLLMQYPVGKVNIIMVDPSISGCFSGLESLGKDKSQLVSSLRKPSDINEAMANAKASLAYTKNNYNSREEIKKYLKKGNRSLIAIADFPKGFTKEGLEDLDNMIEKGTVLGMNFIIVANPAELNYKHQDLDFQRRIESIKGRMQKFEYREGFVFYLNNDHRECCRDTQDIKDKLIHRNDIIPKMCKGIREAESEDIALEEIFNEIENQDIENQTVGTQKEHEGSATAVTIDGVDLPIGKEGMDDFILTFGRADSQDSRHHMLVEGTTGLGKTTLLHAIITSSLLKYSPRELQLVLIDYKNSVEFKIYSDYDLPAVRINAVKADREFARNIFLEMKELMNRRYELFKEYDENIHNIKEYREKTHHAIPKILFIIDEFETLIGKEKDEIAKDIIESLSVLVKEARAAGIHVLISSQNIQLPDDIKNEMDIRFAYNGSKNLLKDNSTLKVLESKQVLYHEHSSKGGARYIPFQPFIAKDLKKVLNDLAQRQQGIDYETDAEIKKQVFYTSLRQYRNHPINRFIIQNEICPLDGGRSDRDFVILGKNLLLTGYSDILLYFNGIKKGNILFVNKNQRTEMSLEMHALLGLIYSSMMAGKNHAKRIFFIDFEHNNEERGHRRVNLVKQLSKGFPDLIDIVSDDIQDDFDSEVIRSIKELYTEYEYRKGHTWNDSIFLMINGFQYTGQYLKYISLDTEEAESCNISSISINENTLNDFFLEIIKEGVKYGIYTLAFLSDHKWAEQNLEKNYEKKFGRRIVSKLDDEEAVKIFSLGGDEKQLDEDTAFCSVNSREKPLRFKVFEMPGNSWIEKFILAANAWRTQNEEL